MIAWVDGDWVDEADGRVPIHDRGYLYGDGAFDTCRLFDGRWLWFDEHARRLHGSADVLGLPKPPVDRLRRLAADLLSRNPPVDHGVLRMTLTGAGGEGPTGDGAARPHDPGSRLVMTLRPLPSDWRERAGRGWRCITADIRHPPPAVLPPALKGQGRVFSLLARREAERAGCDQALLLSVMGTSPRAPPGTCSGAEAR